MDANFKCSFQAESWYKSDIGTSGKGILLYQNGYKNLSILGDLTNWDDDLYILDDLGNLGNF